MARRVSDWTKGTEQPDGGWVFLDAPMTPDVVDWEKRQLDDGSWECRAIYRDIA